MQILVQNNRVVDYCPENSYICFGSFVTCEYKSKTFYDCTIVTLINTELPSDIDSSEYLYIEGSFIRAVPLSGSIKLRVW